MSNVEATTSLRRPPRKRVTRNPKKRRDFDLPDNDDEREPIVGPGTDPKGEQ